MNYDYLKLQMVLQLSMFHSLNLIGFCFHTAGLKINKQIKKKIAKTHFEMMITCHKHFQITVLVSGTNIKGTNQQTVISKMIFKFS